METACREMDVICAASMSAPILDSQDLCATVVPMFGSPVLCVVNVLMNATRGLSAMNAQMSDLLVRNVMCASMLGSPDQTAMNAQLFMKVQTVGFPRRASPETCVHH